MNCATAYPDSPMHGFIKWGANVTDTEYKLAVMMFLLTQRCEFDITDNNKLYLMLSMLINLFYFPSVWIKLSSNIKTEISLLKHTKE